MPLFYSIIAGAAVVFVVFLLLRIDITPSLKSTLAVVAAHGFLCSRVQYSTDKKLFLKQFRYTIFLFIVTDFFILAIPFCFVHIYFGIIVCISSIVFAVYRAISSKKIVFRPVIPSPFFIKSSFLWHANLRHILSTLWIIMAIFIVIGYLHDNYNLVAIFFAGGTFVGFYTTIFQSEKIDFVQMYLNKNHFLKRTFSETVYNSTLCMLPFTLALLFLFPDKWLVTVSISSGLLLTSICLLWIKYALYPSLLLGSILFFSTLLALLALITTFYGLLFLPVFYILFYHFCKKNIQKILSDNERNSY